MPTPADHPQSNEWDLPPSGAPAEASHRAAKLVWVIGVIEVAVFGCLSTTLGLGAMIPASQFEQLIDTGQWTPDQFNDYLMVRPVFIPAAIVLFVLGFLPGLAYLLAGFAVRQGKPIANIIALVMAATQFLVFGVIFAFNVLGAVLNHNPVAFTLNALTLGSLLLLLGLAVRWLMAARQHRHTPINDPWKHPHP